MTVDEAMRTLNFLKKSLTAEQYKEIRNLILHKDFKNAMSELLKLCAS